MKEHEDDVLHSVKESTATADAIVSEKGKLQGVLGERDEGDDMMVDVVGADVVDDHGGTGVNLDGKASPPVAVGETDSHDQVTEDGAGLGEEVCDYPDGIRVSAFEKDEVVVGEEVSKEVLQGNVVHGSDGDAQKPGNGAVVGESKMASEPSSMEPQVSGQEIAVRDNKATERGLTEEILSLHTGSVQEVVDGDEVMDEKTGNEAEILVSSKIRESLTTTANLGSPEVDVVVVKEGLPGKDEAQDCVANHSLSTEVISPGTGEGAADVSTNNLDQQAEVDHTSNEESLHPTNKDTTNDAQRSGNGTRVGDSEMPVESSSREPQFRESEGGLTEEIMERPMESVQEVADVDHVVNEKTGIVGEVLVSTKVPDSETKDNLCSEEVDVVIVEEGLARKDESQDIALEDPSSVCPHNHTLSSDAVNAGTGEVAIHVNAENLDKQAEVDKRSKEESSPSTIDVTANAARKCGKGIGFEDAKMADEPSSRGEIAELADTERGLTEENVERPVESVQEPADAERGLTEENIERPVESVQELADADHVMDEKSGEEDIRNDAQKCGKITLVEDSKLADEQSSRGEIAVIDREEEIDRGLTEEIVERPMESVQEAGDGDCVMDEKAEKEDDGLDLSKIPKSTMANLGSEEVDVVVVEESLPLNDETQDGVSVDQSLVCPDNQSFSTDVVHAGTGECAVQVNTENLDQQAEVDEKREVGTLHSTITNDAQDYAKGTRVGDSQMADEIAVIDKEEETERGSTEGFVERPVESVQEVGDGDCVMDEETGKDGFSKIPESSTIANLGSEDGVARKEEAKDSVSVDPSSDQKAEDDPMSKDAILHPTIEVITTSASHESSKVPDLDSTQHLFVEGEVLTTHADYTEHGVLPAHSEFSYEEAHVERGEDAGMDIDEVLGWKDEIPAIDALSGGVGCREKDQNFKINASSETDIEQGPSLSCVPVPIEEDLKVRQPIVYERRVHVEIPIYDARGASISPRVKDENVMETQYGNSAEANRPMQEEEQKVNEDVEVHMDFCRDQETALDHGSEAEHSTGIDEVIEDETSVSLQQSCYFPPPENEGEFSASDLVWGKVKSHPWWPGQVFDSSDASEKAMKYHKKDCFLVAYFGDRSFAWNDSAVLKPFRASFCQMEKHSCSDSFKNAVSRALEEVSRRVELGLACSCVSHDSYKKIEYQVVENAGIKQESSRRHGLDKSTGVDSFEPDKLVDYVRLLAKSPNGEGNKIEIVMAKAQLSCYGRYKGHRQLPEFLFCGNLLEDTSISCEGVEKVNKDGEQISAVSDDPPHSGDGEDGTEGLDGNLVSSSGVKKRKALDPIFDGLDKRPSLHTKKVATVLSPTPKPSFKVGECIQRVASQLTGPPSVPKGSSDKKVEQVDPLAGFGVSVQSSENSQSSVAEMLSQLRLAAQDPMKGYSFLNTIIPFFYSHRSAVFSKSIRQNSSTGRPSDAKKRKPSNENDPEEFEFDDVNDSYWTDRIIQNYPEEQLLQDNNNSNNNNNNQNGGGEYQLVTYEPVKPSRRSNKKRFFNSNHEIEAKEQSELMERRRQNLATEVLLKFTEGIYFPSEIHLNKMFRRFGPLIESETEVDRQSGRARVVFKKCSDAEVAHSSAGKFSIFGSINVSYELNYSPLVSYKPLPLPVVQDPADAC